MAASDQRFEDIDSYPLPFFLDRCRFHARRLPCVYCNLRHGPPNPINQGPHTVQEWLEECEDERMRQEEEAAAHQPPPPPPPPPPLEPSMTFTAELPNHSYTFETRQAPMPAPPPPPAAHPPPPARRVSMSMAAPPPPPQPLVFRPSVSMAGPAPGLRPRSQSVTRPQTVNLNLYQPAAPNPPSAPARGPSRRGSVSRPTQAPAPQPPSPVTKNIWAPTFNTTDSRRFSHTNAPRNNQSWNPTTDNRNNSRTNNRQMQNWGTQVANRQAMRTGLEEASRTPAPLPSPANPGPRPAPRPKSGPRPQPRPQAPPRPQPGPPRPQPQAHPHPPPRAPAARAPQPAARRGPVWSAFARLNTTFRPGARPAPRPAPARQGAARRPSMPARAFGGGNPSLRRGGGLMGVFRSGNSAPRRGGGGGSMRPSMPAPPRGQAFGGGNSAPRRSRGLMGAFGAGNSAPRRGGGGSVTMPGPRRGQAGGGRRNSTPGRGGRFMGAFRGSRGRR